MFLPTCPFPLSFISYRVSFSFLPLSVFTLFSAYLEDKNIFHLFHLFSQVLIIPSICSSHLSLIFKALVLYAAITCFPHDLNAMNCHCNTFITSFLFPFCLCVVLPLRQSIHILFALLVHFNFLLFPPLLRLLPLCAPLLSALRLASNCLERSYSASYSSDWNNHRQFVVVSFAQEARGNGENRVGCAWRDETVGVSKYASHQLPKYSLDVFSTF